MTVEAPYAACPRCDVLIRVADRVDWPVCPACGFDAQDVPGTDWLPVSID